MSAINDSDSSRDLLDMAYINSLPQPLFGNISGWWWPVVDIEVQTGLVRVDACGLIDVKEMFDFRAFRDASGIEHPTEGFYVDALPEDREPINSVREMTP